MPISRVRKKGGTFYQDTNQLRIYIYYVLLVYGGLSITVYYCKKTSVFPQQLSQSWHRPVVSTLSTTQPCFVEGTVHSCPCSCHEVLARKRHWFLTFRNRSPINPLKRNGFNKTVESALCYPRNCRFHTQRSRDAIACRHSHETSNELRAHRGMLSCTHPDQVTRKVLSNLNLKLNQCQMTR